MFADLRSRFITLDATSRDDMLRVMMTIRTQTLHGDYVQARLKATASAPVETAPPMPLWPAVTPDMLAGLQDPSVLDAKQKKKRKKKKKKRKSRNKASAEGQPSLLPAVGGSAAPPPSMGEDDFPTIQVKKVEFVTMPKDEKPDDDEEDRTKSLWSDAASTATTNSSSLDSFAKPKPFTGYAAALLKAPSPVTITEPLSPSPLGVGKNLRRLSSIPAALDTIADVSDGPTPNGGGARPPVTVLQPGWGRGRSFADILREDCGRATSS